MTSSGHLRMPNDLVEILARLHLNGTQWQILWAVWRQTLCWQIAGDWGSRSYPISIADLALATNLNEAQVRRELAGLVELNIVLREKSPNGKPAPGGRGHKPDTTFNIDTSAWKAPIKGSLLAPLSDDIERGANTRPIGDGKGSGIAPLNEVKGRFLARKGALISTEKGSGIAPLSPSESKLGKKHIKKQKETIYKKEKRTHLGNVLLTDEEYQKLIERFGEAGTKYRIAELSEGIYSKGYKYLSHFHTILSWERRKEKEKSSGKEKEKPIEGLRIER